MKAKRELELMICHFCNDHSTTDVSNWKRHINSKLHHRRVIANTQTNDVIENDNWNSINKLNGIMSGLIKLTTAQIKSCIDYIMKLCKVKNINYSNYFPYNESDVIDSPDILLHDIISIIFDDFHDIDLISIRNSLKP